MEKFGSGIWEAGKSRIPDAGLKCRIRDKKKVGSGMENLGSATLFDKILNISIKNI
jgi:hypothetical protein